MRFHRLIPAAALVSVVLPATTHAQAIDSLPPDLSARVAAAVADVIRTTQVPSASVGIVRDGRIAYIQAFGQARLSPPLAARPDMHYAIGSISKQFTVAAIMLLQQEGKLSIDQPVSTWLPELTRASEVTLRNLMSHTSGYSDYAPQDYTIPAWTRPTTAQKIVHEWATQAARLRSGHPVPVQQHQLQHRRPDRREGERPAVLAIPRDPGAPALGPPPHDRPGRAA